MEIKGAAQTSGEEKLNFVINLTDPVFSQGVIMTDQGGVITAENLRIQARHIEYADRVENGVPVKRIVAEGDLMMEYGGQAFVGRRLEFNFLTKSGTLWDGKTYVDYWFLGGERIELREDESYYIYNAYITTCDSQENAWEISTKSAQITKDRLLSARNVRFNFFRVPVFWIPTFKFNLKWLRDPPIRYKLKWDTKLGPRLSMRYKVYSWENFKAYLRFDYRFKRGPGGALETDYRTPDTTTIFRTRNYGAYDKVISDERGPRRFRLQGLYQTQTVDERTKIFLTYDRLSDPKMPQDFKSSDFEINTQQRTILTLNHQEDFGFGNLRVQPRINRFQSLNQELPLITLGFRPFQIGPTGIISENFTRAAFLDYTYAKELHKQLHNKHALRLETNNRLYRPVTFSHLTLTPEAGFVGIFYNNSPEHASIGQAIFSYGAELKTRLAHDFAHRKHLIEPYLKYEGYSRPKASPDRHYVFNIDDGYAQLNIVRLGLRNTFFSNRPIAASPGFVADVYSLAFFKAASTFETLPRLYSDIGWLQPSFATRVGFCYNFQHTLIDYVNVRGDFTVNSHFAFGFEYRQRSKYDWRKGDHESFVLDVARHQADLLDSPLSDRRNTVLTRFKVRFTPRVTCYFESHHGWHRVHDPCYNEARLDLNILLAWGWRFKASIERIPGDWRKTFGLSLSD